ncbi:outer membrane protein [Rhodopseudomonas sp. P2A-2r]|uniref:outer membrane protein n=1 Tax=unclassified Rhodopseudomonas TaxID=2638247 RepID=UPI0022345774|nr:outer membrane beta-barrel protein [Rhodopseudomonas sp. P2A-2r]UZE50041.1 outer membrane beta-barrel protein [Rhodopseudomonas sp. P2A-2r]
MPVKPYTKAPALAAAYDWSGFYLGVNAGVGVGRDLTRLSIPARSSEQTHLSPFGAIGGIQAGYNWQIKNWVLGLEADIQGAGQQDDACLFVCSATNRVQLDRKLDWFGTVRGRIGYTTGPVLGYFTGGFAYGNVKTSIVETATPATFGGLAPAVSTGTFVNEQVRTGYAIGSGVEAALGGNWTGKLEYLYLDLGSRTGSYTFATVPHTVDTNYRDNIFRAGLNYRIGSVAAYAPPAPANWSGSYVGGNFGSGYGRNRSSYAVGAYNEQFDLVPQGFLGGGQVGYNWQSGAWVAGVEADFQGSTQKDDKACLTLCTTALSIALDQKLSWLGRARGRLGYTVGSTLFYATGGFAYGEVKTDVVAQATTGGTAAFTFKNSRGGWTAGGGIERPMQFFGWAAPNWTSKTEYLYVDLGRSTGSFTALGATHTFSTSVTEHIFRTGLNYHFDTPVIARF